MDQKTFESLSKGDKVVYTTPLVPGLTKACGFPPVGTVLTRHSEWMDDENTRQFTFQKEDGSIDFHFFAASEIEEQQ